MDAFQVTHHRPDNSDTDRCIQGLGGPDATAGGLWYRELDFLLAGIDREYRLWTIDRRGNKVWVRKDRRNNREFLTTETDGITPNNLLALPHC